MVPKMEFGVCSSKPRMIKSKHPWATLCFKEQFNKIQELNDDHLPYLEL